MDQLSRGHKIHEDLQELRPAVDRLLDFVAKIQNSEEFTSTIREVIPVRA